MSPCKISIELHPCRTAKILTKPFFWCVDLCENLDNCCLYFCGFSLILVPIIVAYWSVVLAVLFAELCVLVCSLRDKMKLAIGFGSCSLWVPTDVPALMPCAMLPQDKLGEHSENRIQNILYSSFCFLVLNQNVG